MGEREVFKRQVSVYYRMALKRMTKTHPALPLATALVAVHNEERHIRECLQSLLAQDYAALEILVVDDGSTDATVALARAFSGVRVLPLSHAGKALALNRAARE